MTMAHKGCGNAKVPAARSDFWAAKLQTNADRDQRAVDKLAAMGGGCYAFGNARLGDNVMPMGRAVSALRSATHMHFKAPT